MELTEAQKQAVMNENARFTTTQLGYLRNRVGELAAEVADLKEKLAEVEGT